MVKFKKDFVKENITDLGNFELAHIINEQDRPSGMNILGVITVQPGEEIAFHVHEGESDTYYVLSGVGEYVDNDMKKTVISTGDAAWADNGQGHAIKNMSEDEPLLLMAIIPFAR